MNIIQIVGYKNSGKTTLAAQFIDLLSRKGLRVASLKHHGHGGVPLGIKDTDSEKHKRAGALVSGVEGDGVLQLSQQAWNMEQIIAIYELLQTDVLVVEGYKNYPFPKIVLINREMDLDLLDKVKNIKAIISTLPLVKSRYPYPVFNQSEISRLWELF
ncbi:molybdopterin-guanine dinucleotide biosynthesis protein B [Oceanobacillus salinisoli]|uniref:molybdopterin-guanine dinucleotide biosynthesis protein B n=1 Tax=Oceanobacillus salinisoli TaxID=2678611 RepID=UPI0012E148DD|nr:molybdopterin-guanine dinucleotide biosynthesis protein B [Oceanobacillus salinisoli]